MSNEQTSTLVFKDQAGEHYLLPQETLNQWPQFGINPWRSPNLNLTEGVTESRPLI